MLMIECHGTFQWKPSIERFGEFRRFMWGYLGLTICPYDINDLFKHIAKAGAEYYNEEKGDEIRFSPY